MCGGSSEHGRTASWIFSTGFYFKNIPKTTIIHSSLSSSMLGVVFLRCFHFCSSVLLDRAWSREVSGLEDEILHSWGGGQNLYACSALRLLDHATQYAQNWSMPKFLFS